MCTRSYKWKHGLTQHQRYECGKEPRFGCPINNCFYRSKVKCNIRKHVRTKHKVEIEYRDIKLLYENYT